MNLVTSRPSLPRCNNRGVLVCVVLRCKLSCAVPPTSLDSRLASWTLGVSKDENRCKFLGDRRPMNSRERSTGRAHLPHYSRLRRLILSTSETIQISMRATNCFHLYDVLARVCRDKGSGLSSPEAGSPTWKTKAWMCLVDNSRLTEGVVIVEAVSRIDYRQVTMTAMIMRYVQAVCTIESAHRRQLLTWTITHCCGDFLILGTATAGDVYKNDLVILTIVHF